jgi:DNA-binding CsgD family transcriptional regulator
MLTIATAETEVLDAVRGRVRLSAQGRGAVGHRGGNSRSGSGHSTIAARVAAHLLLSVRTNDAATPSRPSPGGPELSRREREVLTLVTDGCDNAEIAGRLYMSVSTVKNHVSRLFEKLGVDNRVQAATATREGLPRPEVARSAGTGESAHLDAVLADDAEPVAQPHHRRGKSALIRHDPPALHRRVRLEEDPSRSGETAAACPASR